eukprot:TRINITY_DN11394_c0_g1_i1.p1 TRINITY_DN11394_c0_g1~~TRINITY_DN11394_c0_g1_i1.p1  ORF type:complete len:820 (-),score=157.67 TRINITY_DN11394_c0_g1_i1:106-2565(-)
MKLLRLPFVLAFAVVKLACVGYFCLRAYRIRLHAINTYGYIIHEFDPWFNYRATEYLAENGAERFFKWYDYMSWYPIGRPIGTTIYPGMQFAAVWIWEALKKVPEQKVTPPEWMTDLYKQMPKGFTGFLPNKGKFLELGPMSLNDVCCMVPPWFGASATLATFLWTRELSESTSAGVVAAFIMAILPAHLMRSYGGEFENEAVAMTCFVFTLYFWSRSIRTAGSWPFAVLSGLWYFASAATWGGYIFINNLIALHAASLVGMGKFSTGLWLAYSIYYIIGTGLATRIPVIGLAPLRALEQMPSLLTFGAYQLLQLCDFYRSKKPMSTRSFFFFRAAVFMGVGIAGVLVAYVLLEMGYFMPLGARIRGLFLSAVKTGNPLVDSVAEHRPSSPEAYAAYLGEARHLAVVGLLFCWHQKTPAKTLAPIYALVAWTYSLKMSRLILICAPIVSLLAGYPAGIVIDWCLEQVISTFGRAEAAETEEEDTGFVMNFLRNKVWNKLAVTEEMRDITKLKEKFATGLPFVDRPIRVLIAAVLLNVVYHQGQPYADDFIRMSESYAKRSQSPRIVFQSQLSDGRTAIIDDYYQGYLWLRKNTPEDARVMAWWDYGYQITGVANRTSIADGNTWNHEHIATLGKILTSPEKKSWNAQRHLTDYVLVWAGGRGDDMAKSPHLARIGNSVFPDHCGDDDPMCHKFGFYQGGKPTPMMADSFLYKAVRHNIDEGVRLNSKYWQEVHTTKYGLMRIFKVMNVSEESKAWCADPKNKICDAPGSWYCVGQYPPALQKLIEKRRSFVQLEDFNMKGERREKSAYSKLIEKERDGN